MLPGPLAGPALVGAMLLLLVTLPVTLPVSLLLGRLDARRLRAAAAETRCVGCGRLLVPHAPAASDAAHMAALAEAHRQHPGMRVHVARRAHARCPSCGTDYVWDRKRRSLDPLSDPWLT